MTAPGTRRRVLVVGRDGPEVLSLHEAVEALLARGTAYLALELDTTSQDPALAWGTELPIVRDLVPPLEGSIVQPEQESTSQEPGRSAEPLAEDGDSWRAINGAARRYNVDLVVMSVPRQSWISRLFSGSAAGELVANGDVPVLLVHLPS